jgi:hypothetical protein
MSSSFIDDDDLGRIIRNSLIGGPSRVGFERALSAPKLAGSRGGSLNVTYDSLGDGGVLMRGDGERTIDLSGDGVEVRVELREDIGELLGHVVAATDMPIEIEVQTFSASLAMTADNNGRFVIAAPSGPLRLTVTVGSIVTSSPWLTR